MSTNNAWNAPYNNTKGSILVGNGTRPIVRTVGSDGQVLTANSAQADGVEWQTPGSGSLVNLSPYIVGATQSDFTTIQAAINQAVLDGASSSNQINIYIKPGTYTENLVMADGVNLVSFVNTVIKDLVAPVTTTMPVVINGTITFSTPITICSIQNVRIVSASSDAFIFTERAYVSLFGCSIDNTSFSLFRFNTSSTVRINLNMCSSISGFLCDYVSTLPVYLFAIGSNIITQAGATVIPSGSGINVELQNSYFEVSFDATAAGGVQITAKNTFFFPIVTLPIVDATGQGFGGTFENCYIFNSTDFIRMNSGYVTVSGTLIELFQYSCTGGTIYFNQCGAASNSEFSDPGSNPCEVSRLVVASGFNNSQDIKGMKFAQTLNDTPAPVLRIELAELQSVVIRGKVIGANAAHTDTTGGDFMVVARRASGGNTTIVNIAYTDVKATSTGSFSVNTNIALQSVDIEVTGLAATAYNWAITYDYQKMLSNA